MSSRAIGSSWLAPGVLAAFAVLAVCTHGSNAVSGSERSDAGVPASIDTLSSVLEHHNGPRRDGVYVDSSLARATVAPFHPTPPSRRA